MRLTDEMIQEDDKRFKRQNLLAEFNYCGKEVPKRKSITNDDIRFYAWLCRSAYDLLKVQDTNGWVSVKDRLPNEKINPNTHDFEYVLCYTIFGDVRAYKYGTPMLAKSPHFWDEAECVDEYVTHWQYMPEPPKEVSE